MPAAALVRSRNLGSVGKRSRAVKARAAQREARRRQAHYWRASAEVRGCLLCRLGDGGFDGCEHPVAESLGNTEVVLPPGVVCDRCNNGPLSVLDQVMCDFMPVAMRRTMLGIRSKAGNIPKFRSREGTVDYIPGTDGADPTLRMMPQPNHELVRETARLSDGRVALQWKGSGGRRMTPRYACQLSRALLKSALECAWLDHGQAMLEPKWDHVRAAVLGEPRAGFFAVLAKADPNSTKITLTYNLVRYEGDTWRMWVAAEYYGVFVATDSRLSRPVRDVPDELLSVMTFTASDLRAA